MKSSYLNPYIIAEVGVNHEGDMQTAKQMITLAAEAGCNAVKFQLYKADRLASKDYSPAYWDQTKESTPDQYSLFRKYDHFNSVEYHLLAEHAHMCGIDFIVTPFDQKMVEVAEKIADYIKIASADITNIPLLRACAATGKPLILSTGASNLEEIDYAIRIIESQKGILAALLHCVLNYPLAAEHVQLNFMDTLFDKYADKYLVGYSDHVTPLKDGSLPVLEFAAIKGAAVLEKHFTLSADQIGNDHYHSFTSQMIISFKEKLSFYHKIYGNRGKNLNLEQDARNNARRKIFVKANIKRGEIIKSESLIPLRANVGIDILQWDKVVGMKAACDFKQGDYLSWGNFEDKEQTV